MYGEFIRNIKVSPNQTIGLSIDAFSCDTNYNNLAEPPDMTFNIYVQLLIKVTEPKEMYIEKQLLADLIRNLNKRCVSCLLDQLKKKYGIEGHIQAQPLSLIMTPLPKAILHRFHTQVKNGDVANMIKQSIMQHINIDIDSKIIVHVDDDYWDRIIKKHDKMAELEGITEDRGCPRRTDPPNNTGK